jgi:elongation factor Ts
VAKTDAFEELGARLSEHLAAAALETVDELIAQPAPHNPGITVADYLNDVIAKTGESVRVRHFSRCQGDLVAAYIHFGGKIGVMLELTGVSPSPEAVAAARDVAMQVAATAPLAVSRESVAPDEVEKEKAIFAAQAKESGKPDHIIEKMVTGRLEKFFKEVCLLEQAFVKNPDITVAQFLKDVGKSLGAPDLKLRRFVRYQIGA